jgi:hypothetical protein
VNKLVVLGTSAVAASTIGLLSAGLANSQPANPNQMNVIGEPYYKAVKILKGMGLGTGFGGSVGSDLPQAQCMVASQKMVSNGKMLLNLDCTEEAAQQMAEQGSLGSGSTPGTPSDGTLRPPQIPIAPAPAPVAPPAG